MTVTVTHKFRSEKADSTDASLIRPSNWNDSHTITMASQKILGRVAVGEGPVEELAIGTGLSIAGGSLSVVGGDAATLGGSLPAYYMDIISRLGYRPVRSAIGAMAISWNGINPIFQLDAVSKELAWKSDVDVVAGNTNGAYVTALAAFSGLRTTAAVLHQQSEFTTAGDGRVLTGIARVAGDAGGVIGMYSSQLQGFSPSRGWVPAFTM